MSNIFEQGSVLPDDENLPRKSKKGLVDIRMQMLFPKFLKVPTFVDDYCHFQDTQCADFELSYHHCLEAVGYSRMGRCMKYADDFRECALGKKRLRRLAAMQLELERQKRQGLITESPADPPFDIDGHYPKFN